MHAMNLTHPPVNFEAPLQTQVPAPMPPSVNYHLIQPCNMRCKGCFATFHDVKAGLPKGILPKAETIELSRLLGERFKKVTFAGGEPTLVPWLKEAMAAAKRGGATVMLVTNGTKLTPAWLRSVQGVLDWVTISIDSPNPETHVRLGRSMKGKAVPTAQYLEIAKRVTRHGMRLKINTVVSSLNLHEDFRPLLLGLRPERWKLFQILPIEGQNDDNIAPLLITRAAFREFRARHEDIARFGVALVPEDNTAMTGSYAMVSPDGKFYDNATGSLRYGERILDIGLEEAWARVAFDADRFNQRGGVYDW